MSAAPVSTPASSTAAVRPRRPGTVYGGSGADRVPFATMPLPTNPVENSGSLTGHILAQGWTETPATEARNTTKVVVMLAVALAVLVAIGLIVVVLADDAIGGLLGR